MTDSQGGAPKPRLTCGDCAVDIENLLADVEDGPAGEGKSAAVMGHLTFHLSQLGGGEPVGPSLEPNHGVTDNQG